MKNPLYDLGQQAQQASFLMAQTDHQAKNDFLLCLAKMLRIEQHSILDANQIDMDRAYENNLSDALCDRLKLDASRIEAIAKGLEEIASLPDPVGQILHRTTRPNGLVIEKTSVPLGVIGIIFESRPNVAIDAAALCIKAGNACILRGGSDSYESVKAFTQIMQSALRTQNLPHRAVQIIPSTDRILVGAMLQLDEFIDVIIPRGGKNLIARIREESRIPVFSHLDGICHTYIDVDADETKARVVTLNAKMRRTGICGATECLILHKDIAETIGRAIIGDLISKGCVVKVPSAWLHLHPQAIESQERDYGCEFLSATLAVQIVDHVQEAVAFINTHGSHHTDAILTENRDTAHYFQSRVNSAIAVHNASTQFADGGEFGMGAEIGIATGKLHARGPVGLEQLVTYQYRVHGNGQTRP
jgi:glutamate-5-semialdehyde dehydrogenase